MAKILSMPKGASKSKIYENGAFGPGMENPGAYVLSPGTQPLSVGALIQADRFVLDSNNAINTAAIIGTASQFDFTPYSNLYIRCKGLTDYNNIYGQIALSSSKTNVQGSLIASANITSNSEHTIIIDVSSVTNAYISFNTVSIRTWECYEIWAE
ncbi:hypothetical protein J6V85_00155 [Candidatus Saccharibacteria bacterium]|nr:hypothetical protein [Candidatus Saccharibacteria bacterium]